MPETFRDGRLASGDDPALEPRLGVLAAAIVLVFLIFFVRLFQLQIVDGAALRERSERNFVRTVRLEAPRGDIVDRNGRVFATTRPAYAVQVIPNEMREADRTYRVLAALLDEESVEIAERVGNPRGRGRFQPVVLDGDIDYEELVGVESYRYAMPGVVTDILPRRQYVDGRHAAHLLGTIGQIEQSQLTNPEFSDYRGGDIIGQSGLEALYESHLRGRAGGRNLVVDVAGREIEVIDEIPPMPGGRLVLTLDVDLQRAAEHAFDSQMEGEPDKMGALVAIDPNNGDVLALVSRPAYDPNAFAGGIDPATWRGLRDDDWEPLRNRALSGHYPPGSTYKAIVAIAGLSEGEVTPTPRSICPGYYRLGRRVYRCWKRGGHGNVDLAPRWSHSCDVYLLRARQRSSASTRSPEFATGFGLGHLPASRLAGREGGSRSHPGVEGADASRTLDQGRDGLGFDRTGLQPGDADPAGGRLRGDRQRRQRSSHRGWCCDSRPGMGSWFAKNRWVRRRPRAGRTRGARGRDVKRSHGVVADARGTGARARVAGITVGGKTGTTQVVSLDVVEAFEDGRRSRFNTAITPVRGVCARRSTRRSSSRCGRTRRGRRRGGRTGRTEGAASLCGDARHRSPTGRVDGRVGSSRRRTCPGLIGARSRIRLGAQLPDRGSRELRDRQPDVGDALRCRRRHVRTSCAGS